MPVTNTSAYVTRNVRISWGAHVLDGIQSLDDLTAGGTASDIDISTLESLEKEFEQSITDPGQTTMTAVVDPSTPTYDALLAANKSGVSAELRVIFGSAPAGATRTDGSGFKTYSFGASNSDLTFAAGKVTIAKATATGLPAVKAGHYIQTGSGPTYTKIKAVNVLSSGNVELVHDGSALVPATAEVALWKPAFEIRRQARVMDLKHKGAVDTAFTMDLTFRNTGAGEKNSGAPALTI